MSKRFLYITIISILLLKLCFSVFVKETSEGDIETSQFHLLYSYIDILLLIVLSFQLAKNFTSSKLPAYMFLAAGILIIRIFVDYGHDIPINLSIVSQLKILLPLVLLSVINGANIPVTKIRNSLWLLTALVLILSLYAIFYFPNSVNREEMFWPVYFSGLHTQAYIILSVYIFVFFFFLKYKTKYWVFFSYVFVFFILFYGYNVRTSIVSLLAFTLVLFFQKKQKNGNQYNFILLSFFLIVIASILVFLKSSIDFDFFSSGRLSMYYLKYQELLNRDLLRLFFGSGSNSDLVLSDIWWWEEKGSHNDYITIIIEGGLVNFSLLIILYLSILKTLKNPESHAVFVIYFVSSMISNGYISRPLPSYLLMLVVSWLEADYFFRKKAIATIKRIKMLEKRKTFHMRTNP